MLDLLERQQKLTANQWKLIGTTNLADLLDFFDFFLIGYVLAFITKEWQLGEGADGGKLTPASLNTVQLSEYETIYVGLDLKHMLHVVAPYLI